MKKNCDGKCRNCLFCCCSNNKYNSARERRKRYLKEIALGKFSGTWNEYQYKCKLERYEDK